MPSTNLLGIERERFRIATMTRRQLETRLSRLTNLDKLYDFAQALEERGYYDLALQAQEKRAELVKPVAEEFPAEDSRERRLRRNEERREDPIGVLAARARQGDRVRFSRPRPRDIVEGRKDDWVPGLPPAPDIQEANEPKLKQVRVIRTGRKRENK